MSPVNRTKCRSAFQRLFLRVWTESIFASVIWAAEPRKPVLTSFLAQISLDVTQSNDTPRALSATWTRWRRFPSSQVRSSHEFGKWKSPSPVTTPTWESYPPLAFKSKARKSSFRRKDLENSYWYWIFFRLLDSNSRTRKRTSRLWYRWGRYCMWKSALIQKTRGFASWQ